MNKLIVCLLLTLNCSCALTRKTQSNQQKNSSHLKMELSQNWDAKMAYKKNDSSHIAIMLEIWPNGPFSFSPDKGFEGQANKILITQTRAAVAKELSTKHLSQKTVLKATANQKQQSKNKATNANQVSPVIFWALILLCMIGFIWLKIKNYRKN